MKQKSKLVFLFSTLPLTPLPDLPITKNLGFTYPNKFQIQNTSVHKYSKSKISTNTIFETINFSKISSPTMHDRGYGEWGGESCSEWFTE